MTTTIAPIVFDFLKSRTSGNKKSKETSAEISKPEITPFEMRFWCLSISE